MGAVCVGSGGGSGCGGDTRVVAFGDGGVVAFGDGGVVGGAGGGDVG